MFSQATLVRWLQVSCLLTSAIGLVAAAGSHPATEEPWRLLFDVLSWPVDGHPAGFSPESAALSAVSGGVMVGWGVLMFGVVSGPIARGDRGMCNAMIACVVSWFLVDSAGSLLAGLPGNVALNVGSASNFLLPLFMLRSRAS
jgi:hypothetical protein